MREESWTLGPDEHALLSEKRGAARLDFAVSLRFFARLGRFPHPSEKEIDGEAVAHVEEYASYGRASRTHEYYRAQIREAFVFRRGAVCVSTRASVVANALSSSSMGMSELGSGRTMWICGGSSRTICSL
jgi:hypothetical protein